MLISYRRIHEINLFLFECLLGNNVLHEYINIHASVQINYIVRVSGDSFLSSEGYF